MKKVYVAHSKKIDYNNELYLPITNSELMSNYDFIFPHNTTETFYSKEIIKTCEYMVAEISKGSMGLGIEIGWADILNIPIIFVHRENVQIPEYFKNISNNIILYKDYLELPTILSKILI
jgi:hypothetical protein